MGVALYTALVSALLNYPVKSVAVMTGEITLRGKVMSVGKIEEKITAAYRAGIKTVFIPERNRYHLADIEKKILNNIEIICVSDVDEVIDKVL